ncbi:methyltransferase domain-containing protein [Oceanobacillus luteolus]|uniref:Class I SAM-dependent methyltransferase n=1 Tax=Oceanobacillus luteolus TaxID=1274358 RepID=A0ABW4HS86_9BACI|nr:class I SAM-dependent methyltransferase [Oceanobacillus luteolus]MCM3740172.1 methyltransferase domain-containing protein [Oceanobacillus luteolus]
MLKNILHYAHYLLEQTLKPGEITIDATCGNGNDTLYLAELVGKDGKVLAFDIQEQAIHTTKKRLNEAGINHVTLIQESHEYVDRFLGESEQIGAAIFNLGYLPRSDKTIITESKSTIPAVEKILTKLRHEGLLVLVVYHGHKGGKEEKDALLQYVTQLDQKKYHVLQYQFINQKNNPPFLLAIEKLTD